MQCDKCQSEATVYRVDKEAFQLVAERLVRPGQVLECQRPFSLQKFCDDCWMVEMSKGWCRV